MKHYFPAHYIMFSLYYDFFSVLFFRLCMCMCGCATRKATFSHHHTTLWCIPNGIVFDLWCHFHLTSFGVVVLALEVDLLCVRASQFFDSFLVAIFWCMCVCVGWCRMK